MERTLQESKSKEWVDKSKRRWPKQRNGIKDNRVVNGRVIQMQESVSRVKPSIATN